MPSSTKGVSSRSRLALLSEIVTAFARVDGRPIGIIANQPMHLGEVLFVDSADKAAPIHLALRCVQYPAIVPCGRTRIHDWFESRAPGDHSCRCKMIAAVSEASVPKLSIIVRKAYGAGLYAMCGPAFEPLACLALPTASIAVIGPQAAVNAVFYDKLQEVPEGEVRDALVAQLREEYRDDIDILKLASNLVVDSILPFNRLRDEIVERFSVVEVVPSPKRQRKHLICPM